MPCLTCFSCHIIDFLPPSPCPPSPPGKGEIFSLFRRGLRPRHPCIRPFAALIVPAMRAPRARSLRFAAKPTGSGSLWAVPSAKERGDRGRWNYPSQATAAFEMVLSPGAGKPSAAGVQLSPPAPRRGHGRQGESATSPLCPPWAPLTPAEPAPPGFSPGDARGEAPCMK